MIKKKTNKIKKLKKLNTVEVTCITCDHKMQVDTTLKKDFKVNVCSNCHPFYLGKKKFESKAGRMERFRKLQKKSAIIQKQKTKKT